MNTNKRYATAVLAMVLGAGVASGVAAASPGSSQGQASANGKAKTAGSVSASASMGVKPSASTNGTHNTNAMAASTQTKIYGNGKTAGQIAMQNGAGATTNLYGPGNSQPHKASLCANGKTHLVDVHALKAHGGTASCTSTSSTSSASTSTSTPTSSAANVAASGKLGATANANGRTSSKGVLTPPHATNGGTAGAVSGQAKAARPVTGTANFTG